MHCTWLIIAATGLMVSTSLAQNISSGARYLSEVDQALTIRRITVLPVTDNVGGIYSRPMEAKLIELAEATHRWDYQPANFVGAIPLLEELEESPERVKALSAGVSTDALLLTRLIKGPTGIAIKMNLFLTTDGRVLTQENLTNYQSYEIEEVKNQTAMLYQKVISKIPYQGLVLSRQNTRITINLGSKDGIKVDDFLSIIQIIKANRHPRFHFIIDSEKEILGRVKILKVDDTLSFGVIVSEKERGAIDKGAKVDASEQIKYEVPSSLTEAGKKEKSLLDRIDHIVSFGENPQEWLPTESPQFGQVGCLFGLSSYSANSNLSSTGNIEATSGFASLNPSIGLMGELWIDTHWITRVDFRQGILSTDNPVSGGSPKTLNHSLSHYAISAGYNLLLKEDFFGPKLTVGLGISQYKDSVDDSTPTGLTTTSYGGVTINLEGSMPVSEDQRWRAGLAMKILLSPSLQESPVKSGASSDNSVNDFQFTISRRMTQKIYASAGLNFLLLRSAMSGGGNRRDASGTVERASSLSQNILTLNGGLNYMF